MEYVRNGNTILLRLDKGDEIMESIRKVAESQHVTMASVVGLGATDNFTVGVFNTDAGKYDEFSFAGNCEINNLTANVTTMQGKPYVHAHITCTQSNGNVVGGHLLRAVISLTCEMVITVVDVVVERKYDEVAGINKWKLQ